MECAETAQPEEIVEHQPDESMPWDITIQRPCLTCEELALKQDDDLVLNWVKLLIKLNQFETLKPHIETPDVDIWAREKKRLFIDDDGILCHCAFALRKP